MNIVGVLQYMLMDFSCVKLNGCITYSPIFYFSGTGGIYHSMFIFVYMFNNIVF